MLHAAAEAASAFSTWNETKPWWTRGTLSKLANLNLPPFDASQIKLDFETYPINIKPFGPITIPKNIGIPGPTGDAGAMKFNPMLQGINSIFGQYGG